MQSTDELSPRQAAEVFTALRFWARATRYNAEDAERALLSACESRSNRNWVLGAATGALAGLAVGLQLVGHSWAGPGCRLGWRCGPSLGLGPVCL